MLLTCHGVQWVGQVCPVWLLWAWWKGSFRIPMMAGSITCWSMNVNATDTKKVEGANIRTLRTCTPKPPSPTCSDAWIHWMTLRSMITILITKLVRQFSVVHLRSLESSSFSPNDKTGSQEYAAWTWRETSGILIAIESRIPPGVVERVRKIKLNNHLFCQQVHRCSLCSAWTAASAPRETPTPSCYGWKAWLLLAAVAYIAAILLGRIQRL